MATSRFAAKATVGSVVSANRFEKITLAAKIGMKAMATANTARGATGRDRSHELGTNQARVSPPSKTAYITGSGGVRKRRVVSTAASTATSTPAKTKALTTQVVPNRRAKPVTLLVSSSRKAAPSRKRSR